MVDIIYRIAAGSHETDRLPSDGPEARRRLERGNREFAELVARHGQATGASPSRSSGSTRETWAWGKPPAQRPFAAVLAWDLGLEEPPTDLEAFARLGARLAEGEHVRRLLAGRDR